MDAILDSRNSWHIDDDTENNDTSEVNTMIDYHGGYSLECNSSSSSWSPDRYGNDNDTDDDFSIQSCSGESCSLPWIMEEITTNLLANNPDFSRLELDDSIEDIVGLIQAIHVNKTVREVEVHIEALEGLSRADQLCLADAICNLPELRSLLVYKNSLFFVEPLLRHRPFLLENLRLCKLDISESSKVDLLVSALESLPSLSSLDVGFDSTNSDGVLAALTKLKPIYVDLECFRIDYKLQEDAITTTVNGDYTLDDRIVVAIAETIGQSHTLKTLSLPPFSCTEQCYETLIDMLERNYTLERIDYWVRVCNLYYPDANETIDHLLHLNESGVRRMVRQDTISSAEVMQLVTDKNEDLDSIYHLFSSDPSLLPTAGHRTALSARSFG